MDTFSKTEVSTVVRWRTDAGKYTLLFVITCAALLLLLANLGNQYLWEDEAETALVSKTILTDGVPRGYDGKNFFSQGCGADYGDNYIWRRHAWLPFYILAGFYEVCGVSTFVSRLPFVLFGVGTVLATYFFARAFWSGTRIPAIAAALLTVSVPFLLLCRQCRYFSMTMFFSVLSLYAYVAILHKKKYAAPLLFVTSILLFHCQYFYIVVLFATILLHAGTFRRDRLIILLVVIVAAVLINGPWLVWLIRMNHQQSSGVGYGLLHLSELVEYFKIPVVAIIRYVFPLWLLAVVAIAVIARRIKTGCFPAKDRIFWERLSLPFFFVIFNIVTVVVASYYPFFRYTAPSIPLLIILIAVIIDAAMRVHKLLAVGTIAMLLVTSQLKDFLYEITHDFDGPEEGIASYLNEHGSPNDVVAITFGDMPLKFYTKMRIVGGFTCEDLEPAKNARWVIIRKYIMSPRDDVVRQYLLNNIDWVKYRQIVLDYPDTPWENREDPASHYFRTSTDEDRVVIYEKID